MPMVRVFHGPMAGQLQEVPLHAAEAMITSGQAVLGDKETSPPALVAAAERRTMSLATAQADVFPPVADENADKVVTVESDAAGEVVKPAEEVAAEPFDQVSPRATEGRAAEPRRGAPEPEEAQTRRTRGPNRVK